MNGNVRQSGIKDGAKQIADDEMAELKKLLAGNMLRRFREINEEKAAK